MLSMIMDSTCMVTLGVYFWVVKKIEPIILTSVLITLVLVVVIMIFIPESPKFLYEKGRIKEFEMALLKIAAFNGKSLNLEEIRSLHKQFHQKSDSFRDHNEIEFNNVDLDGKISSRKNSEDRAGINDSFEHDETTASEFKEDLVE